MDFSSEDGLTWHEKRHNKISLKLGLSDKSDDNTDQTPTPTRFIRNCEEVGLFQDLQHVNPFDETFKKAIQSNNNGTPLQTLGIPGTSGDDTLHTPHIFPPLEDTCEKPISRKESIDDITLVIDENGVPITYDHGAEKSQLSTTANNRTNEADEHKTDERESLSIKLKQISTSKTLTTTQQNTKKDISQNDDDCVIINTVSENQNNNSDIQNVISKNTEHFIKKRLAMQRVRECNRNAQARLRSRRKMNQKRMEFHYKFLQAENAKLKSENIYLRDELIRLKGQIEEQSKTNGKVVHDVVLENKTTKAGGTSSLYSFTRETPIFPKPIPESLREEIILSKKPSAGPPLILPKPANQPNTVIFQLPILQGQTLPIVLANNSQIALAVQNPPVQSSPRQILPLPNPVLENGPGQNQQNHATNISTTTPTTKRSKKRRKRK